MCKLNHSQVAGLICATDSSLNGGKGLFVLRELTQAIVLFTCCQFTIYGYVCMQKYWRYQMTDGNA